MRSNTARRFVTHDCVVQAPVDTSDTSDTSDGESTSGAKMAVIAEARSSGLRWSRNSLETNQPEKDGTSTSPAPTLADDRGMPIGLTADIPVILPPRFTLPLVCRCIR